MQQIMLIPCYVCSICGKEDEDFEDSVYCCSQEKKLGENHTH